MYDVEKLVSIVCDYLDAEADYMKYSLDARKELGLAPDSTLWIPSLNGSKAYRLGELSEKSGATGSIDDAVIRNALLTAVNRITLMDEKSGEFEAGDGNQNMVTFEVSE